MNRRSRGPGKPEESVSLSAYGSDETYDVKYSPNRNSESANHRCIEAMFWSNGSLALSNSNAVHLHVHLPVDYHSACNGAQDADQDTQERQTVLPCIEPIHGLECERVGGEEGEEYAEREAVIQAQEENDWFRHKHVDGSEERDGQEEFDVLQSLDRWSRGTGNAEFLRSPGQDHLLVRLLEWKYECKGDHTDEDSAPLRPSPAFVLSCEAANDRS